MQQDLQDQPVELDKRVLLVKLVVLDPQALKDKQVPLDHREVQVLLVQLEVLAKLDKQVLWEELVQPDQLGQLVTQGQQDQ